MTDFDHDTHHMPLVFDRKGLVYERVGPAFYYRVRQSTCPKCGAVHDVKDEPDALYWYAHYNAYDKDRNIVHDETIVQEYELTDDLDDA